jgi:hypothetical protein
LNYIYREEHQPFAMQTPRINEKVIKRGIKEE